MSWMLMLAAAAAQAHPNTVSEVVIVPPKLVDELVVTPHPKCLDAEGGRDSASPQVVSSFPAKGQVVRPGLLVFRVTFDRPMTCSGFLAAFGDVPNPCPAKAQRFVMTFDRKTVRTLCITQPATSYAVSLGDDFHHFLSLDAARAQQGIIRFQTSDGPPVASIPEALAQDVGAAKPKK